MLKTFNYIEFGPELNKHDQLYRDGLRKQEKMKEQEIDKQIQYLKSLLAEPDPPSPKQQSHRDFYNYSIAWKNLVKQKQFQSTYSFFQSSQASKSISKLPSNYISPINGWKQHAQHYNEVRTQTNRSVSPHHPTINEKSRNLSFHEPVEDRLIKYGQQKEQRLQYEKQWEKFYTDVELSQKPTRANDEVFDRLYNFERKEPIQEEYKLNINRLSPEREERVKQRREKYKLYENRKYEAQQESIEQPLPRVLSQNEFDKFLQRNFGRAQQKQLFNQPVQEEEEDADCTYKPQLNKKSLVLAEKKGESLIERQQKLIEQQKAQRIHVNKSQQVINKSPYNLQNLIK